MCARQAEGRVQGLWRQWLRRGAGRWRDPQASILVADGDGSGADPATLKQKPAEEERAAGAGTTLKVQGMW